MGSRNIYTNPFRGSAPCQKDSLNTADSGPVGYEAVLWTHWSWSGELRHKAILTKMEQEHTKTQSKERGHLSSCYWAHHKLKSAFWQDFLWLPSLTFPFSSLPAHTCCRSCVLLGFCVCLPAGKENNSTSEFSSELLNWAHFLSVLGVSRDFSLSQVMLPCILSPPVT